MTMTDQKLLTDLLGDSPSRRRRHAVAAALAEASDRFPAEKERAKRAAFVLGALWYRGNGMADYADMPDALVGGSS